MQKNLNFDYQLMGGPVNSNKPIIDACGPYGSAETTDQVCGTYGANIAANVSPETLAKLEALKTQARIDAERGMPAAQFSRNQRALRRFVLWYAVGFVTFWGSIAYYWVHVA